MLMMVTTVTANTSKEQPNSKWDYNYHDEEPISFTERGIKFFIFPDGEMDFDIHANDYGTTTEYYYKSKRNNARNRNQRGTKVVRDYRGRVIRVGRVFINYNYKNKISRVGSIFISYRRNLMTRIGSLRLVYDRYGDVRYIGQVKYQYHTGYYNNYYSSYYNNYFYDNYVYSYHDDFFSNDDFSSQYEQFNEDEDYYYYRSKGVTSKMKNGKKEVKKKMIKRKKDKTKITKERTPKKRKRRGRQS